MYPNLPLGESQSERQDNVAGSLRCSWEGRRQGDERETEREGARKREGLCLCDFVCVQRERDLSVQAREIVW